MNTKVTAGLAILAVSTVLIFALGGSTSPVPGIAGSIAALGFAAGSLLVGTSGEGRPV